MVYEVFDAFRPFVSAVSWFACGFHAKMRYGLETESSRSQRRGWRVPKKMVCQVFNTFPPSVSAVSCFAVSMQKCDMV